MKSKFVGIVLAALLAATSVPVYAAGNTASGNSFDQTLAALYENSMSVTDSDLLAVSDRMQNDFTRISGAFGADASSIEQRIKAYEAAKQNYFLGKSGCDYGDAVRKEWDLQKQYLKFQFGGDYTVNKLIPRVRIDAASVSGTTGTASVYEWTTVGYTKAGDTTQNASGYTYSFKLDFTKSNGGWTVAGVGDTSSNFDELEEEGVTITANGISAGNTTETTDENAAVGADVTDPGDPADDDDNTSAIQSEDDADEDYRIDWSQKTDDNTDSSDSTAASSESADSSEASETSSTSTVNTSKQSTTEYTNADGKVLDFGSFSYDLSKAIAYADKWALSRNPSYSYYGGRGGDCSNFVSQCLHAGGFPMNSAWYGYGHDKDAKNWISQNDLRAYLVGNGYGKLINNPSDSDIRIGNPVWYKWSGSKKQNASDSYYTNHVTLCVGWNASGTPIIDSHTTAYYHHPWNYGPSTTVYKTLVFNGSEDFSIANTKTGSGSSYSENTSSDDHSLTGDNNGSTSSDSSKNSKSSTTSKTSSKTNSSTKSASTTNRTTDNKSGTGNNSGANSTTGGTEKIYRLYNKDSGEHFYTHSTSERRNLIRLGWKAEGIGWIASKKSSVPIYRLYNPNNGDHHYTTSKGEYNSLEKKGWKKEGVLAYSCVGKSVPLYRAYNPNAKKAGAHHYTTSKGELNALVAKGWRNEGIGWYGEK